MIKVLAGVVVLIILGFIIGVVIATRFKRTKCAYCGRPTKGAVPRVRGKRWCGCCGVAHEGR